MARGKRIHEILTGRRIAFPTGEVYNTGVKITRRKGACGNMLEFWKGTDRSGHHRRYPGIPGEVSGGAGHGGTGAEAPVSLLRKEVWEAAAAALLCGENLLLAGSKATGKNVLAENLAMAFGRPAWDVSFHVNMDAASLIGMDTFVGGEVTFRPGPVYLCAKTAGSAFWMRSIWRKTRPWPCCMLRWTFAGPLMCPGMTGWRWTRRRGLSAP